ncbi:MULTISPECIES: hypothetical protein [Streptomyces]|uniref:Uncharacterized protein n=4 Tax=Streptomyces TaxID=1883 RepID=A0A7Y6F107_9ACTN|nr:MULTISPECIES: hypothetical protein [Streptomyces]NUV47422.1 hypothetical protein [Streptomyces sp. CAI-78]MCQ9705288.1 hypothetical protein [Streptomyces sp. BSP1]MCR0990884.1 hypothetical protein [Streptomyces albidoflavus]MDH6191187.1 hypothetical protein [Streptomyces sp. CZ24]NUV27658.1 hypothetical protein [Streptomyces odorifer]
MGDRTTCTESGSRTAGADSAVPRADEAGPDPGDDGGGCTGGGARLPAAPARPLPVATRPRPASERRPSRAGATAAGATALLVVLLLGGVAGEAGGITGIALGLALFAVLVATARPWRYVLPHFLAGLWIIGFASAAFQDALLLTRGEWVSAVVTRDLHARTGPRCDLADLRGRALPPTTTGCGSHGTGDRVRVLADPLRLVPSRFESPPVRDACLTWGAAGAVHVAAGAAAGYGARRGGRGPGRGLGGIRASRSNT